MNHPSLRSLPKVELHCHLDGGLRVETVLELAADAGYDDLPSADPSELSAWFFQGGSGSLVRYLAGFEHTVAVMQTQSAIERVAYEAAVDMHNDGVVYGESRFAPALNTRNGLRREDAIEAALSGFASASAETGIAIGLIVDAIRDSDVSVDDAEAAVRFAGSGVVGFDLAGPEVGFPPEPHQEAFRIARDGGLRLTVHAGEADGPASIQAAIESCGAERIGHGIRIVDEIDPATGALGPIAARVHDRASPLEICPTSNRHTLGIDAADHPLGTLTRAGFTVTLNTDNRLMSSVTLTDEFDLAVRHHSYTVADLKDVTQNAVDAAFVEEGFRLELRRRVEDGYESWLSNQSAT